MQRVFDFLRTDDIPRMARGNFALERSHYILWTIVLGAVESNLAGIVAAKTFGASPLLTSVVWATPVVMMSLNVVWGVLIRGRRRLPMFRLLTGCAALLILSIGFTSPDWRPWGGWVFAAQIALTHVFTTGLLTLRVSLWNVNYPASHRGRIIGRLQTIRFLFVPVSGALIAAQFDLDPDHYRIVYPAAAGVALLSLVPLGRFRARGERRELRDYAARDVVESGSNPAESRGFWRGLREAVQILRTDREFRRYMIAQFTLGSANFFTDPVLLAVLTSQLALNYLPANMIMAVTPGLCSWVAIRFWAPYFDRVGVLRFRVVNCVIWVAAYSCVAIAMLLIALTGKAAIALALTILVIGRILKGVAHGGGMIAWSIGHLHFAREHQGDLYMSIHVALTGTRALLLPYLGLVANSLLGNGSFAIAILFAGAAFFMFRGLAAGDERGGALGDKTVRSGDGG